MGKRVTLTAAAKATNRGKAATIKQLRRAGVRPIKGKYDLDEVKKVQAERAPLNNNPNPDPVTDGRLSRAGEALKYFRAKREELRYKSEQKQLIPRADVDGAFARCSIAMRTDLLSLPGSLAGRLVGLTAVEIHEVLKESIDDVLRHIAAGIMEESKE